MNSSDIVGSVTPKDNEAINNKSNNVGEFVNIQKTIDEFEELFNSQKDIFSYLAKISQKENDKAMGELSSKFNELWETIEEKHKKLISTFVNPPSKEELAQLNKALNLQKSVAIITQAVQDINRLNIEENFSKHTSFLTQYINVLENFTEQSKIKVENFTSLQDDLFKKILKDQEKEIKSFQNSKMLKDLNKTFKFLLGGAWGLTIINIVLAISLGFMAAYSYFEYKDFEDIKTISQQLNGIKIQKDGKNLILEIPKNAKIVNEKNIKKIIFTN